MLSGVTGRYEWLEVDYGFRAFLRLCPEVIEGKSVAITSLDSGFYSPSQTDMAKGWKVAGNIAYSPCLGSTNELPMDCCGPDSGGYDEWYVFEAPRQLTLHTEAPKSDTFKKDLMWFTGVCNVLCGLRGKRVGAIGAHPAAFNTVRYSEKLLESNGANSVARTCSPGGGSGHRLRFY